MMLSKSLNNKLREREFKMENTVFKSLLKEIKNGIKTNKNVLDKAIQEAMSKGEFISIDKLVDLIDSYADVQVDVPEGKNIAVTYTGKPEITLTYMLDSILYNNRVTLCTNGNKAITEILYTILNEGFVNLKIKNQWVEYDSNYNEIFLKENQNKFDKIVYIGDYFEYERFKVFFKKQVEYNNYGYIKLFIDKVKYSEEYKKIIKYTYVENIALEVYDDIDDFIRESREEDFAVIFADFQAINKIQKELKAEEILFNTFPYDSYKFKIER